jgi:hypothetical protein
VHGARTCAGICHIRNINVTVYPYTWTTYKISTNVPCKIFAQIPSFSFTLMPFPISYHLILPHSDFFPISNAQSVAIYYPVLIKLLLICIICFTSQFWLCIMFCLCIMYVFVSHVFIHTKIISATVFKQFLTVANVQFSAQFKSVQYRGWEHRPLTKFLKGLGIIQTYMSPYPSS